VFDLRELFGIAQQELTELSRVIVVGEDRPEFGVLADVAQEVTTLRTDAVFPPLDSVGGAGRDYVRGVTKEGRTVLDGLALLQAQRLFIDQGEDSGL
jgi:chemotaxis signal transduction protein